eukprot:7230198-Alexandrium_andersonii.AAC.1
MKVLWLIVKSRSRRSKLELLGPRSGLNIAGRAALPGARGAALRAVLTDSEFRPVKVALSERSRPLCGAPVSYTHLRAHETSAHL